MKKQKQQKLDLLEAIIICIARKLCIYILKHIKKTYY